MNDVISIFVPTLRDFYLYKCFNSVQLFYFYLNHFAFLIKIVVSNI